MMATTSKKTPRGRGLDGTCNNTLTTGQVAKLCDVAPRTAGKWVDSGKLVGYRIPGSQDRRVPRENLIRFLKENRMPLGELAHEDSPAILALAPPDVGDWFPVGAAVVVDDGFWLGVRLAELRPSLVILDAAHGDETCARIARAVRQANPAAKVWALAWSDQPAAFKWSDRCDRRGEFDPVAWAVAAIEAAA